MEETDGFADYATGDTRSIAGFPTELLALAAGSGMNPLMAATDWLGTPLGPVERWPAALRTAVGVCVNSPFAMLIMWGPELAMVYNDAFVPILGARHPALGHPAAQVWQDAWPVVGGMIAGVYERGEAVYHEDLFLLLRRNGFDEEVYFTFSYSPILLQDGTVGGVLTVVTETTTQVLGERRMATLQRLGDIRAARAGTAEQTCEAAVHVLAGHRADLPFGLVYLLTDDGQSAQLAASYGLANTTLLPASLPVDGDDSWIWDVVSTGISVHHTGLAQRLPGLVLPGASPIGEATVDTAVALPLSVAGQSDTSGVLVVGVSPYLPLDTGYLGYLELVAGQVTTAISDAQAYAAQRQRAEQLAELDRAKTEFFTGVSHELRTPLALIAGPVADGLADTANPLQPAQRQRMEIIHRNSGRLRRLVDNLLDFARIEGGQLRPEPVAVDLAELTRGIARSFAPAVERAGLAMSIDCDSDGCPLLVDPDMWEKILLNLLSNAVKFTLDGAIEVRLLTGDDVAELRVSDTGVGIPADELPLLFQRFRQVRGVSGRSHEGSGIGLALVHELAGLLGGGVEVASRIGEGTTFTVHIPVRRADNSPAGSPLLSSVERHVDEALQWSPPASDDTLMAPAVGDTVLIAEDNADLRLYLAGLLAPTYTVVTAVDGADALDQVRRRRPDLVLADVMMPKLDGFGLLRALRTEPATASIPVVFLSARAGEGAAIEGLAAGADDYLVKPFSSAELLARVRSHLDLARLRNHESAWRTALVNAMQDGFFVATAEGTVIEVNDAFTTLLGYHAEELPYSAPHPWWPSEDSDPHGFAQVTAAMNTVLASGTGRLVLPLRHRDGHTLWADVAIDALRDRDGDGQLIVGTLRDVTAEHLAVERAAALARLAARLARIDDSNRILSVGLAELHTMWQAQRASMVRWNQAREPVVTATTGDGAPAGPALPPAGADGAVGAGQVVTLPPTATGDPLPIAAIGEPLSDGAEVAMVWLEFAEPRTFTAADRAVLAQLCDHLQRALSRGRAYDEQRRVALALQRAILGPTDLPDGFAVRYEPAGALEVGGDWYDVVTFPDGRYGLAVGDVVGRGLPAATAMGQLRSAGRALLLENNTPAQVLSALDKFADLIPKARCTTMFCAVVDPHNHTVCYSSAGHLPAIIVDTDGASRLLEHAQSVPLSVIQGVQRPESTATLPSGSTLVLYTDGLVERRGGESLDTGIDRAIAAITDTLERPLGEVADHLAETLMCDEQDDDMAFLIYRGSAHLP